jgi:hypothetical protein
MMNTSEPSQFYSNYKIELKFAYLDTTAIMKEFGPIPDARTVRMLNRLKRREMNGVCEPDLSLTLAYPPGVESYSNKYTQYLTDYMTPIVAVIENPVESTNYVNDLNENPVLVESETESTDSNWTDISSLNEDEIIMLKENDVPFVDLSGNTPLDMEAVTEVVKVLDVVNVIEIVAEVTEVTEVTEIREVTEVPVKVVEPACTPCCVIS